jgi:hypothetical protein
MMVNLLQIGLLASRLTAEGVGSSPGLKSPALILSPLLLLEYQP